MIVSSSNENSDTTAHEIKIYYRNGNLYQRLYVEGGRKNGIATMFDSLGRLQLYVNYVDDIVQNSAIKFNKYGFPQEHIDYDSGKMVRSYYYKHCGLLYKEIDHVKGDTTYIDSVQNASYSLDLETVAFNGKSPQNIYVGDTIMFIMKVIKSRYTDHTILVGVNKDTANTIYGNDGYVSMMDNYLAVDTMRYNISSDKHEHSVVLNVDPGKYNFEFTLIDYAKDSSNCESTGHAITVEVLPAPSGARIAP